MKRAALALMITLMILTAARAEPAGSYLSRLDLEKLESFSDENAEGLDARRIAEEAAAGQFDALEGFADALRGRVQAAAAAAAQACGQLLAPALMLALLRNAGLTRRGGTQGAGFVLRISLLAGLLKSGAYVIEAGRGCIQTAADFADAVAPTLSVLMTALGRADAAALVSPAEALVGDVCVGLFAKYGLPLCRFALCTAVAGALAQTVRLDRVTGMLSKTVCWGTGFCVTAFTALAAIRSGLSASIDSVTVRAAKYAVDSAAPVIGSGVSDAWDTVVSGVCVAKNAVGISGIAVLLAACALPLLKILSVLVIQNACAALIEVLGDRETAAVIGRAGVVCKMTLAMCTGSIAISIIFLGAAMNAGAA